ncbi:hypothetical protein BDV93DRAFT_602549 [Ceratobasidium sp. AG-I]|nr:hypothetical protein BDV93DRAFT_602549 [Ceratobasidium sp. AG-I]
MASPVAPSTFSKLLRQSKFASYDPAINQVYTSFGGYSHRGHWGAKRDLPPKRKHKVSDPLVSTSGGRGSARRNPVAFISALDSAEGQTEWASAEKDARWLRRLEELGTGVSVTEASAWRKRVGSSRGRATGAMDSEFDTADSSQKIGQQMTSALPNTLAMSERRFKSYISHLRGKRKEFHEFLQEAGVGQINKEDSNVAPLPVQMYHYAQGSSNYHTRFLAYTNQKAATQATSNTLTPVPHPSAGLDYLNPTPLMSQLLYPEPIKGRYVQGTAKRMYAPMKYPSDAIVSLAGYNAMLTADNASASTHPINWQKLVERDFSQPIDKPTSKYRVERLELTEVPRVVGQSRQNIEGADIKMRVRDWSKQPAERPNPHRPGTFEYVSHEDTRTTNSDPVSWKTRVTPQATPGTNQGDGDVSGMMELLDNLLAGKYV